MENQIYYIDKTSINDNNILAQIYKSENLNYFWSDDFSPLFYIDLAKAGFISVSMEENGQIVLLPEIQFEYALLDFKDLHISKKVKKLLNKNEYTFHINKNFDLSLNQISLFHKDSWLNEKYISMLKELKENTYDDFELKSIELYDKDGILVAAELGYSIAKTYTSLSGFSLRDKKYNNWGKLQLILLAKYLERNSYDFWNLGHPYMQYKFDIGAKLYSRDNFLKRWQSSIY